MPTTTHPMLDELRRLATATLAYALGVALVAGCLLPTILTPLPVAAFLPKPPPIVARSHAPLAAPAVEVAP